MGQVTLKHLARYVLRCYHVLSDMIHLLESTLCNPSSLLECHNIWKDNSEPYN